MKSETILVFGATGQQGGAVASALKNQGRKVRAFVRDAHHAKAQALVAQGIEVVSGDLADEASIDRAMIGVWGVFSVQPSSGQGAAYNLSDEQEIRYGKAIADSAVKHGVQHLVYSSVGAAGKGKTGMGHFDSKTEIEDYIQSLGLPFTIVRPASFMEMLMLPGMGLEKREITFFMRPGQTMQMIAVEDIGKIVAAIFANPLRFSGRAIEISGDEVTGDDLQRLLTQAAGEPITYHRFADSLLEQNAFLRRLAELVDDGRVAGSADIGALNQEFGGLISFEQWLAGSGKALLEKALSAEITDVSLR